MVTRQEATDIAHTFRTWLLKPNGEPKKECIDYAFEELIDDNEVYLRLYADYDEDGVLIVYIEVWKGDNNSGIFDWRYSYEEDDLVDGILKCCNEWEKKGVNKCVSTVKT